MRQTFDAERDQSQPMMERAHYAPCGWCHKQTPAAIMSQYGARCVECFEAYCEKRQWQHPEADYADKGRRAWAYRLRDRHRGGDRITKAQIEAYRAVVNGVSMVGGEE